MFVQSNPRAQERARALREQGESVKDIAAVLGVSSSSVSRWVRDVPLSDDQVLLLAARSGDPAGARAAAAGRRAKALDRRRAWQEEGRAMARLGDPLHRTGCMLYWAEGSKRRNTVIFVNSDVAMVRVFVRFLRECFSVGDDRIALSVNCFLGNGLSLEEIERYWLEALALPPASLRAAAVNRASSASRRTGRVLLHGTARVTLHSTEVAQKIYGAIQEYGGFDRPEWLD